MDCAVRGGEPTPKSPLSKLIHRCAQAAQQGTLAGRVARGWTDMAAAVLVEAGVIPPAPQETDG